MIAEELCVASACDLLIGMLLVSGSGLMEKHAVEAFHHQGVQLSSFFIMQNFNSFQGK